MHFAWRNVKLWKCVKWLENEVWKIRYANENEQFLFMRFVMENLTLGGVKNFEGGGEVKGEGAQIVL